MNNIFPILLLYLIFLICTRNSKKEKFSDTEDCQLFKDLLDMIDETNFNDPANRNGELQLFEEDKRKKILELVKKGKSLDEIKEYYADCTNY